MPFIDFSVDFSLSFKKYEIVWILPGDINVAPFLDLANWDVGEEVAQLEECGKAESEGPRRDFRACRSGLDGEIAELGHRSTGKKTC